MIVERVDHQRVGDRALVLGRATLRCHQAYPGRGGDIGTEQSDEVPRGHLVVVTGADFDPRTVAAPTPPPVPDPAPTSGPDPITASGAPCID